METDPLYLTDSMLAQEAKEQQVPKVEKDATTDPNGEPEWRLSDTGKSNLVSNESIKPAILIIPPDELWRCSFTPKGAYITRVSVNSAISPGWKYTTTKETKDPLKPDFLTRLELMDKQYKNKRITIQMLRTGAIFGRSLVYKEALVIDKLSKFRLRVVPIREEQIIYNEDGTVKEFIPIIRLGWGNKQLHLDPKECYLFIWDEDESGNGYQGISALLSVYQTIIRSENVADQFATTIKDRGLGIVDVEDTEAETKTDLKKLRQSFRLGDDRVFVHGSRYKMTVTPGVQTGFNFDTTMERWTKETSSGSGYPGMAMEGVQSGAVTGSETDQDNRAQKYNEIREMANEIIPHLHKLEDPKLDTNLYEPIWDFQIRMDKGRVAQVKSVNAQTLTTIPNLFTVNEALELMELPKRENESEGDMLLSDWNRANASFEPVYRMSVSKSQRFTETPEETNEDNPEINKLEALKQEPNEEKVDKKEIAKRLLSQGDSYNKVNTTLKRIFKSGLSNKDIKELKD